MINLFNRSEAERISVGAQGAKALWYPLVVIPDFKMPVKGKYKDKYPIGAVVHFTAGRSKAGLQSALSTAKYGKEMGYTYFSISSEGDVVQSFPLDSWGNHCGVSTWPGLGTGLSSKLVGIEVCCAGRLSKDRKSWFGETYDVSEVSTWEKKENVQAGTYHKYTEAQVEALTHLLVWLKWNNPDVFSLKHVLGHDEVAPTRKNDPGGSLGMTMPDYRNHLWRQYIAK